MMTAKAKTAAPKRMVAKMPAWPVGATENRRNAVPPVDSGQCLSRIPWQVGVVKLCELSPLKQRRPMMAKGSVRVSKSKPPTPAKGEESRASSESFGQLFEPLASVRRDIDRFFEHLAPEFPSGIGFDPFRRLSSAFELGGGDVVPHVEVTEDKKSYEVTAELPGVEEKDVNLSLQDDVLTLSGEKKSEHEEKKEGYHMSERSYGSFRRSFRLPDDVNADRISAKFDKGVMTITLPRVAGAKPKGRSIPIK